MNLRASRNLNLLDLMIEEVPVVWKMIDEILSLEKSTFLPQPVRYSEPWNSFWLMQSFMLQTGPLSLVEVCRNCALIGCDHDVTDGILWVHWAVSLWHKRVGVSNILWTSNFEWTSLVMLQEKFPNKRFSSDVFQELIRIREQTFSGAAPRTPEDDYIAWADEEGTPMQYYLNNWRRG